MRQLADTGLLVLLSGAAFVALRQDAVHGLDMHYVVRWLAGPPDAQGPYGHFGFHWLVSALFWWNGPDAPFYPLLQAVCAVASALAVGAAHRACLVVGLDRTRAALAALGAGATLTWLHFATVVEIHGVFVLPAMLAWWALALAVRSPSPGRSVLAGAVTAAATAMHYSGHLLALMTPLAILCRRPFAGWRPLAVMCGQVLATHVAVFVGLRVIAQCLPGAPDEGLFMRFMNPAAAGFATPFAEVLWREWVVPMAPWSVLFPIALRQPATRMAVLMFAIAATGYVFMEVALFVAERGAYALPMALPAAVLCASALRRGWLAAFVVVAMALAYAQIRSSGYVRPSLEYAQAVHHWHRANPRATIVLGLRDELDPLLVHLPPLWHRCILEPEFAPLYAPGASFESVAAAFDTILTSLHDDLVLSATVFASLSQAPDVGLRTFMQGLGERHDVRSVDAGVFQGVEVRRR